MTEVTTTKTTNTTKTIAATEIVFLVAAPSTGKTFTGDYLQVVHGFNHVDGDTPIKNMHLPKYKELAMNTFRYVIKYVMKGEDGPGEQWMPYIDEIANLTLDAAKHSDNIVITIAAYRQVCRDYFIMKLKQGGAKDPTVLFLTIDEDVRLESLFSRDKQQAEAGGHTLEDVMKAKSWDGDGELTLSVYKDVMKNNSIMCAPFQGPPPNAKIVDVSGRDISHLDGVDKALGLTRTTDQTYQEILEKVLPIDKQRDAEFMANTNMVELIEEVTRKDETVI